MLIRAKYRGSCSLCGTTTKQGDEIEWSPGQRGTRCTLCSPFPFNNNGSVIIKRQCSECMGIKEISEFGVVVTKLFSVCRECCNDSL